ncbi:hypothetical protein KAH27_05090 [bacterium]|nr:hypothetical protein [bacterium]
MSVIHGVLREEYERLLSLQENYKKELVLFPKGAISKKKRASNYYLYLVYREGRKVITKYIGRLESLKSQEIIQQINERKIIDEKLKQVNKNIIELERILNGKKIRTI